MAALKQNRNLFGGALFSAGIVTAAAMTSAVRADMVPSPTYASETHIFGWDENSTPVFELSYSGFFAPPASYSGGGLEVNAYSGATLAGVNTQLSDPLSWTFSYAGVTQIFTVADSKEMLVEWDLVGWDSYVSSTVRVYELGVGDIFLADASDAPGSTLLTLNPGTEYLFQAVIVGYQGDGDDGFGFARLSNIPAPGSFALLGAGLALRRRRRRLAAPTSHE